MKGVCLLICYRKPVEVFSRDGGLMEYTVLKDHCCVEKGLRVGRGMGRQERKIEMVQERVDNELDLGDSNVKTSGEMGGKREKLKDQESFHKGNK